MLATRAGSFGHGFGVDGRRTDLVPARLGHAIDILLVCGASAVYNAVTIAVTIVDTGAPCIGDFAVTV